MAAITERVCGHLFFPLSGELFLSGSMAHEAILEPESFMHPDHLGVLAMAYRACGRCRKWREDRHPEPYGNDHCCSHHAAMLACSRSRLYDLGHMMQVFRRGRQVFS